VWSFRDVTERKYAEEALQESEKKFRVLTETAASGIFIHQGGKFLYVNPASEAMTGYTREELLKMNFWDVVHPDFQKLVKERAEARQRGEPVPSRYELKTITKNGDERWVDLTSAIIDFEGKPAVLGTSFDITVRKAVEETAKRVAKENATMAEIGRIISSTLNIEEVYEGFAEEVRKIIPLDRIASNIINPDHSTTTITYTSGLEVTGRQKGDIIPLKGTATEEVVRKRSALIIQGGSKNEMAAKFPPLRTTLTAGLQSIMVVPLISKDQAIGVLHIQSKEPNAYSEEDLRVAERVANQISGAIANVRLFNDLRKAEETLRESEMRFRDLYDKAPLGYHEYDAEGRITRVNRTDLEMLGYSAGEMIGQFIWKFNVEEELAHQQVLAKLSGTLAPGRNLERIYRRKDGTTFPVLIEDRLILDETGQIEGIRCTIQDITERKRLEQEMAALQEQLRESQKMEAIGRLAGGIAHDFNNLLTVIKGYSQLSLLDLKESDPLRGNIQEIQKASQRATDLTRHLLAFSRRQILDLKVLDLNSLLRDLDKMLRRIIGEDIELSTQLANDLGRVKIDPGQFEQMILNLAVNARDAMLSGGKLTIETMNVELDEQYTHTHIGVIPGYYVRLSVSDTGSGMSKEVKEKIFEPFFTTKEKSKGTGLGLSTVYGIVKQSEGNIWVYSEPGHGTTFKIYLPRIEEELDILHGRDETDSFPMGSETVLLVEDDPLVRDMANRLLKQRGYKVFEAANGEEALRVAHEHSGDKIHLLLTDVVMPQMGGKELADQLKIVRPDVKVLYTSGYTDDAIVHHGVLAPGTHFLQKPFSIKTLSHKVRDVLDG
jgi:PAS domain S-box-containing protein